MVTKLPKKMGKKAKEHRKKVQTRNQRIAIAHKKFQKEMGEEFRSQMQAQMQAQQKPIYASTGDFIAKNYDIISKQGAVEYLETNSDVAFSK
jgi:hypothetical protein